jgi:hypothetical protein
MVFPRQRDKERGRGEYKEMREKIDQLLEMLSADFDWEKH